MRLGATISFGRHFCLIFPVFPPKSLHMYRVKTAEAVFVGILMLSNTTFAYIFHQSGNTSHGSSLCSAADLIPFSSLSTPPVLIYICVDELQRCQSVHLDVNKPNTSVGQVTGVATCPDEFPCSEQAPPIWTQNMLGNFKLRNT